MMILLLILVVIATLACGYYINTKLKEYDELSKFLDFDVTKIPILTVSMYNGGRRKTVNLIIDTGSSQNIIDKDLAKSLNIKPNRNTKSFISVTGDRTTGGSTAIKFNIGDSFFCEMFAILDIFNIKTQLQQQYGFEISGILGGEFLIGNDCLLDFKDMSCKIRHIDKHNYKNVC